MFKKSCELNGHFKIMKNKIDRLNKVARELGLPIAALCVNFALLNELVDKVIVGIDRLENLVEIMRAVDTGTKIRGALDRLSEFREEDERIILPCNWDLEQSAAL